MKKLAIFQMTKRIELTKAKAILVDAARQYFVLVVTAFGATYNNVIQIQYDILVKLSHQEMP